MLYPWNHFLSHYHKELSTPLIKVISVYYLLLPALLGIGLEVSFYTFLRQPLRCTCDPPLKPLRCRYTTSSRVSSGVPQSPTIS